MPAPPLSDILLCASTGVRSDDMTLFDVLRAQQMQGGGYPETTITGVPPISFKADGTPLIAWDILANMVQTGTPSPDNIIIPQEFGDLVTSGDHAGEYAIPITCGATHTVYLSEPLRKIGEYADEIISTGVVVRRVAKKILNGSELWQVDQGGSGSGKPYVYHLISDNRDYAVVNIDMCTHFPSAVISTRNTEQGIGVQNKSNPYDCTAILIRWDSYTPSASSSAETLATWTAFLASQYAAGTPVCVWYVLAEPTTEQITAPEISTVRGSNTLTIDTTLQPTSVSVTGHIRQS